MARRLAAVLAITASLLLGGCGADYGVDQHGNTVKAEQIDGHWLVLNYWAEWCGPCRTEIPELNAAAKQWEAQGIKVVGVNFDGLQGQDLKQAAETLGIAFTVLAQDPAERYELPRSEALPVTYIIDDKGKVREQLMGSRPSKGCKRRSRPSRALKRFELQAARKSGPCWAGFFLQLAAAPNLPQARSAVACPRPARSGSARWTKRPSAARSPAPEGSVFPDPSRQGRTACGSCRSCRS